MTSDPKSADPREAIERIIDDDPGTRAPLVLAVPDPPFHSLSNQVSAVTETPPPVQWWIYFMGAVSLFMVFGGSLSTLVGVGTGIWGLNHPVGWAWDITGFVFWIGIGHAGTLISAILFLFRQKWRTSINRAAEAMTNFAVNTALQ